MQVRVTRIIFWKMVCACVENGVCLCGLMQVANWMVLSTATIVPAPSVGTGSDVQLPSGRAWAEPTSNLNGSWGSEISNQV